MARQRPNLRSDITENEIFRRSISLLPALARRGVAPLDAVAIAYNTVFLFYHMPRTGIFNGLKSVLKKHSFYDIAAMCDAIISKGEVEFGVNKNFSKE